MEYVIISNDDVKDDSLTAKNAFKKAVASNNNFKFAKRYYIVDCLHDADLTQVKQVALSFINKPQTINENFKIRNNTLGCIVLKSFKKEHPDDYMFFKLKEKTHV
tara:strand:- start:174 stop:488 length:315 start_codon:yes stop_codon:yes gene_type:complete